MAQSTISKKSSLSISPVALLLVQTAAFWPVLAWYVQRMVDPSDEPWGLGALATVGVFLFRSWRVSHKREACAETGSITQTMPAHAIAACFGLTVLYVASLFTCPDLVKAILAVSVLAVTASCLLTGRSFQAGVWGLAMLSLPVIASMQFYLGYPLRLLVLTVSVPMLRTIGFDVLVDGTGLSWNNHYIGIDAACSGVRMLWTSSYLALTLACFKGLNNKNTVILLASSVVAAVVGNVFRATSLFFLEVMRTSPHLPHIPGFAHEGIGVAVFVLVSLSIVGICSLLQLNNSHQLKNSISTAPKLASAAIAVLLVVAAIVPLLSGNQGIATSDPSFPGWPTTFEGRQLSSMPLTADEQRFAGNFPGKIAKFTDGTHSIVLRWVSHETRQLHPSEDCFRGSGYKIKPAPITIDANGNRWGCFHATKSGATPLMVRERICDGNGNSWTDVSEWYWCALMNKTSAPWFSYTVAVGTEQTALLSHHH
jgi:exosortase